MQTIVEMTFGSYLYGTQTPASDLDIKAIYIPNARDILLQRIQPVVSYKRPKMQGEKNTSEDIDNEAYSIAKFLELLAEGQTVALDMLFAPQQAMREKPHPLWNDIQILAPKLFTKQAASFVRYCKQQANKYGIKGSRVAAARAALDFLITAEINHGPSAKLERVKKELNLLVHQSEFLILGEIIETSGNRVQYFEICGKKALFSNSIKSARATAQKLMDEYGQRALSAERNQGVDWKALSHAVRIGHQALEFLTTQFITFPRPEANHLVDIKLGRLPFQQVSEEIETLLVEVETAMVYSPLPDSFDQRLIDGFIEALYRKIINEDKN
ncbi:MAG: nucleotidyltransferase domain-containing protein [Alphaproteobacteria bacterium]|nr:nucleotidyltransferase domain-containing protein [Alphaproteobacteria bacterium]